MRTLIFSVATMLLSGVSVGLAADVSGEIKSLDGNKRMVTLQDGSVYKVPDTIDLSKFKVGEKVKIGYDQSGNSMVVTSMQVAGRP
jgi:Cu/Ag efflux protein CusF